MEETICCPKCTQLNRISRIICRSCGFKLKADVKESKSTIKYNNPYYKQPASQEQRTVEERKVLLVQHVQNCIASGARVDSQSDTMSVIVYGKPVNHILHFLIGLFTFGIWWVVWLVLGLTGGEQRELITVEEDGTLLVQKV